MQKIFLRLRLEGCEVLEIDPDSLIGFRVQYSDPEACYILTAFNDSQAFVIHSGTFDTCHAELNRLHNILDIKLRDI